MPNSAIHYLVGVVTAELVGLKGKDRAWVALFAIAPDLDVVTAIPWRILAPHIALPADGLLLGAWLFDHRGFSHTLLAALLCGLLVWRWKRDVRWGVAAGAVWATHVVADAFTPWPVHPFWPVSDLLVQRPLITTLDPLFSLTTLLASLAVLAPILAPKLPWPSEERRTRWAARGQRHQNPLIAVALVAGLVTVATLPLTALSHQAPLAEIEPAGFPSTVQITEDVGGWTVTERAAPWSPGEPTRVVRFDPAPLGTIAARYATSLCTLEGLGPYAPMADGAARYTSAGGTEVVTVFDPVRNVTGEGGPALAFRFHEDELVEVRWTSPPGEQDRGFPSLAIPQAVVEAARCP